MKRLALVAAAAAFVALGFVSAPANAAPHAVGVVDFGFKSGACPAPAGGGNITIFAGDSITWTNCTDATTHTVTADDSSFNQSLSPGATFTHTFNLAGAAIPYHCEIHASMHGNILVQAAPTTTVVAPSTTTTAKPTTTSSSTSTSTTQTTEDLSGVFDSSTTSSSSTTSTTAEDTTSDDGGNSSGLIIALLVLAIAGVGVGAYAVWRRMQQTT